MVLGVLVQQNFDSGCVWDGVDDHDENAYVSGVVHIWLGRVEERVDLQQLVN